MGDFWGNRWNLAFRDLARTTLYGPLRPRVGARRAMFAVFLASGLAHEAVFSVSAGAGFGLPTAYFLLQGLTSRVRGRVPTLLITGPPAFFLFHPPFVERVYVPFLRAIRAVA
jgi:alginate O-acetyltransferase complex protein AlgI